MSSGSKKWVTEQTSLTGGIVDIYVENKTTLTGAVIASTTGDLTLDTGSLEFSNIKDKDISSNLGGGVNAGAGSESVNATYGFTDKRQTNFATIGEGTITVRDTEDTAAALEGLNRDVTIAQYNTKDGGLQGGFTVDKATIDLITNPDGTVINTAKAVEKGSMIAYSITEGVVKAVDVGVDSELGMAGTLEAVVNARKDVLTIVAIAENKALREGVDKALEKDAASLEGAANEISELVQKSDGVEDGDISHVNLYQGSETDNLTNQYAACYDENGNQTYLNTQGTDISQGGDIMNSLFTEAQRKDNTTNGLELSDTQQRDLAYSRGNQAENLWNRFSETANTTPNYIGVASWNTSNAGSSTLINGTEKANNLITGAGSAVVPRLVESFKGEGSPYWLVEEGDKNLKNIRDKINQQYNMDVTLEDIKNANPDIENLDKIHLNDKIDLSFLKVEKGYTIAGVETDYGIKTPIFGISEANGYVEITEHKDILNENSGRFTHIITDEIIPYKGTSEGLGASITGGPQGYVGFGGDFLDFNDAKETFFKYKSAVDVSCIIKFSKSGTSEESGASWYTGGVGVSLGKGDVGRNSTQQKETNIWNFENKKTEEKFLIKSGDRLNDSGIYEITK